MPAERVVVFARAPVLGRVKTRLAATVGDAYALELYQWLAERTVRALAQRPRTWELHVAAADDPAAVARWFPEADVVVAQRGDDLGARMRAALADALADGCARVVIVGTDCPALTAARVGDAMTALREVPAVIGPALDGGYYLLGATRALPVFDGVPWSTDAVAELTRARLRGSGLPWRELPLEADVDVSADLALLVGLPGFPEAPRGAQRS